jgi:hypothetical protein
MCAPLCPLLSQLEFISDTHLLAQKVNILVAWHRMGWMGQVD